MCEGESNKFDCFFYTIRYERWGSWFSLICLMLQHKGKSIIDGVGVGVGGKKRIFAAARERMEREISNDEI